MLIECEATDVEAAAVDKLPGQLHLLPAWLRVELKRRLRCRALDPGE